MALKRGYSPDGYEGKVYVTSTDPTADPQLEVKDGDRWQVPGALSPFLRYQGAWYAEWLYGGLNERPVEGIPGQKYVVVNADGSFGDMYIVPPNSTRWVVFMPAHDIDPDRGPHRNKLHIRHVFYHVPKEKAHRKVMLMAGELNYWPTT
jgi:hypothetical protein